MSRYVILFNFTEQGIKNVKDTIKRAEGFQSAVEKAGGKSIAEYHTFGVYDIVTIVKIRSRDETMMSNMLATGSPSNVRGETLNTIPMQESQAKIEKLAS
ncbi:MAG: GYD domain-containing protein [Ignavibacteriales bacterium]